MIQLAVSSLTYEGFKDTYYDTLFSNMVEDGYRNVEFNCWYAGSLSPEKIRYMKQQCTDRGIKPIALHVSGFGGHSSEILTFSTAHKMRAIEAALVLGCNRVVASAVDDCESLDEIIRQLECIEKIACDYQVYISLENHCRNKLAVSEDYKYIFDRINSPYFGVCLDGGHLEAAGERIDTFIEKLFSKINHLHLKENSVFGEKTFCKFGEGTTDNIEMIRSMAKRGYQGYMSVELSPEIGENGQSVLFQRDDRVKPVKMFGSLEREK
ncbi:MAG: sugar phosphate isomerase/epimerase [Lachnospiraceae bacterium]|nr:sugar phosphate isomerase/epimerase [Lachnospiraceae bacterium]